MVSTYKVLVLYYECDPKPLPETLYDRILCWESEKSTEVRYCNLGFIRAGFGYESLNPDLIILDTTLLRRRWTELETNDILARLARFDFENSFVAATPHDEYRSSEALKEILTFAKCNLVLSCANSNTQKVIYGEEQGFKIIQILTTHVSDRLRMISKRRKKPLAQRYLFLSYRANTAIPSHGLLGQQKVNIGNVFESLCEQSNLVHDIKIGQKNRVGKLAWQNLLANSRAVLGVPSGVSIMDPDGLLGDKLKRLSTKRLLKFYNQPETFFDGAYKAIDLSVIAARHIEAALNFTPQVLLRGQYNQLLEPDKHYIPLEPNFSNAKTVMERLENIDELNIMAHRTAAHVLTHSEFKVSYYRQLILDEMKMQPLNKLNARQKKLWRALKWTALRDRLSLKVQREYQTIKTNLPNLNRKA